VIYLLDTNILIYLIKSKPSSIARKVNSLSANDRLYMSFVTWAELLKGAEGSKRKAEVLQGLDALARQIKVIYPNGPAICRYYAEQFVRLKKLGTLIGANDFWIACHALAEGATLVTHKVKEFKRISGLKLEDWTS
jgi:tRNA(fMet)-specific endonuclease VapC